LFDAFQCPQKWRVGFVGFYLKTRLTFSRLLLETGGMNLGLGGLSLTRYLKTAFTLCPSRMLRRTSLGGYIKGK